MASRKTITFDNDNKYGIITSPNTYGPNNDPSWLNEFARSTGMDLDTLRQLLGTNYMKDMPEVNNYSLKPEDLYNFAQTVDASGGALAYNDRIASDAQAGMDFILPGAMQQAQKNAMHASAGGLGGPWADAKYAYQVEAPMRAQQWGNSQALHAGGMNQKMQGLNASKMATQQYQQAAALSQQQAEMARRSGLWNAAIQTSARPNNQQTVQLASRPNPYMAGGGSGGGSGSGGWGGGSDWGWNDYMRGVREWQETNRWNSPFDRGVSQAWRDAHGIKQTPGSIGNMYYDNNAGGWVSGVDSTGAYNNNMGGGSSASVLGAQFGQ